MEVEGEDNGTEENIAGSAEDVPVSVSDGGPTGVKSCTEPTSPDMEVTTSPVTSEGKSLSSSSLESSNQCSLQQEVDVGGSEGTCFMVETILLMSIWSCFPVKHLNMLKIGLCKIGWRIFFKWLVLSIDKKNCLPVVLIQETDVYENKYLTPHKQFCFSNKFILF